MSIVRGTTPTFTLIFPRSVDLAEARNIYVTFRKNDVKITLTSNDSELTILHGEIRVTLTQKQTLMLGVGMVEIQVNWTFGDGLRAASNIVTYEFTKQLLTEVLE